MKLTKLALIITALTVGSAQIASATSLHSLNTFGAYLNGSDAYFQDGFGANSGIVLPNTGTPQFSWEFTVPLDHVPGNPIAIGITGHTAARAPCDISLRPNFISVARVGSPHIQGGGASTGLSALDGTDTVSFTATNSSVRELYIIIPPDGVTPLLPLDVITFGLYRSAAAAADTCSGTATVQGAWILVL